MAPKREFELGSKIPSKKNAAYSTSNDSELLLRSTISLSPQSSSQQVDGASNDWGMRASIFANSYLASFDKNSYSNNNSNTMSQQDLTSNVNNTEPTELHVSVVISHGGTAGNEEIKDDLL